MAPTLAEFRRLKRLKEEELGKRTELYRDQESGTVSSTVDQLKRNAVTDDRPLQSSPRRNASKKRNREMSTSRLDRDGKKSKNNSPHKRVRDQRPDAFTDIVKGVEDKMVSNLQPALKNKLVRPTSPTAKITGVVNSPRNEPTLLADLDKVEIIDLMSSDDESEKSVPLFPSVRKDIKIAPSHSNTTGLKKKFSMPMSMMRAIDEVGSATNSEGEEGNPVQLTKATGNLDIRTLKKCLDSPAITTIHEANMDTSTLDESISIINDDAQENNELIEIDPNAAICWSCSVSLGNESPNGRFFTSAFVHSHPLLE